MEGIQDLSIDDMVTFRKEDRMVYGVLNYDGNELMAEISGYDLHVAFNLRVINTLSDAEACANAMADVFYEVLMEQLIAAKADFSQHDGDSNPILDKDGVSNGESETGMDFPGLRSVLSKDEGINEQTG